MELLRCAGAYCLNSGNFSAITCILLAAQLLPYFSLVSVTDVPNGLLSNGFLGAVGKSFSVKRCAKALFSFCKRAVHWGMQSDPNGCFSGNFMPKAQQETCYCRTTNKLCVIFKVLQIWFIPTDGMLESSVMFRQALLCGELGLFSFFFFTAVCALVKESLTNTNG